MSDKITTFAKRLREGLDIRQMTQAELSKESGISKSSISRYLSGAWEGKQDAVYALSKVLNVNEAWLMGYDVPMERSGRSEGEFGRAKNIFPLPSMTKLPLIGTIACGAPILAEENIEDYLSVPEHPHADFCLRCSGDSMVNARILDGDIVLIRKQPDVDDGQIAAVLIDDEATLKRVYHNKNGGVTLVAENPAYAPMIFTAADCVEVRILGRAVAFLSDVK